MKKSEGKRVFRRKLPGRRARIYRLPVNMRPEETEQVKKTATGVRPNLDGLGMETLGVDLDEHGMPPVDQHTSQIGDLPVYLAGDANGYAPLLHEALDEDFIAGRHSFGVDGASACYCRRPPLRIVFSDPQCAVVGQSLAALRDTSIAVGHFDFRQQGRAILEGRNVGVLRLYAESSSGKILGAEMVGPGGANILRTCWPPAFMRT